MTPRLSVIAAAIRKLGQTTGGQSYDPYWDNVVLAMNMDCDQYASNVVLAMHMDGANGSTTFTDLVGGFVTAYGTAAISTTQSKFGGASAHFDGASGGYLLLDGNANLALGTGDFTIEFWFYMASSTMPDSFFGLVDWYSGSNDGVRFWVDSSRKLALYNKGNLLALCNTVNPINTWVHVAIVRSSGSTRVYVNGTLDSPAVSDTTNYGIVANRPVIGSNGYNPNVGALNGYIDDLRITKGVARYNSNFTPPTSAFESLITPITDPYWAKTVLLANFDSSFTDLKGKSLSSTGASISSTQHKYGGASAYFNGSSYVSVASSTDFNFTTKDFTIEAWVYIPNLSGNKTIIQRYVTGNRCWDFLITDSVTNFRCSTNGSTDAISVNGPALTANAWHHVAVVRYGNVIQLFTDGVGGTTGSFTGSIYNTNGGPSIGYNQDGVWYYTGYIDDLRVTKGVARYTSNFTPPAAGFSPVVSFTDLKGHTVTANGGATLQTTTKKYGSGAAYFDGTGDYLSLANTSDFDLSGGDFTIEFWAKPTGNSTLPLLGIRSGTSGWLIGCGVNGANYEVNWQQWAASGGTFQTTNATVSSGQWAHFAIVRASGVVTCYANGSSGTPSSLPAFGFTSQPLQIGQDVGNPGTGYVGYIDDLRITKGVARYTSSFTPPSAMPTKSPPPLSFDTDFSSVKLLMHMDGLNNGTVIVDELGKTITSVGTTAAKTTTAESKFGGSSVYFDGSTLVRVAKSADFNFDTGDFTIEFWLKSTDTGCDLVAVPYGFRVNYYGNYLYFFYYKAGNWQQVNVGPPTVTFTTFMHVAVVRSGSDLRLYVGGTLYSSGVIPSQDVVGSSLYDLDIGDYSLGASLVGRIDELRISKGVARYTADFTPPSEPFKNYGESTSTNKNSILLSAHAGSNLYQAILFNKYDRAQAQWEEYFRETYDTGTFVNLIGTSGAGSDTGVIPTTTVDIDSSKRYKISATNSSWTNDLCSFTLEFLNANNDVVVTVYSTGAGSYEHDLYVGLPGNYTLIGGSGYKQTYMFLTFSATQIIGTQEFSSNNHNSFTWNCNGTSIASVRISNVRAKSTYTGNAWAGFKFGKAFL